MKPKCLTCNKQLSRKEAKYCTHHRDRSGKNNGSWKGGKPHCPICNKKLTHYDRTYCLQHIPNTFQRSKEGREMVSKQMQGNQHSFLGEKASIKGKHQWIRKHFDKPTTCEHCGKTNLKGKQIHWANKDHIYNRDRSNWMRLCPLCHWAYDKSKGLR